MNAPLDMAAGYSGAAFEVLRRSFYKLPANEARRHKLPKPQWTPLSKSLKAAIAAHPPPPTGKSKAAADFAAALKDIEESLHHLNNVSHTKLSAQFLDDLGLSHGAAEEAALHARNDAAHANPLDPDEYATVYARADALQRRLSDRHPNVDSVLLVDRVSPGRSQSAYCGTIVCGSRASLALINRVWTDEWNMSASDWWAGANTLEFGD